MNLVIMIENLREAEKRSERKIGKEKRRGTEIETAREIVVMGRRKGITTAEIIDIATEKMAEGIGVGIETGMMVILTEVVTVTVFLKKLVYITEEGIMIERKGISVGLGLDLFHLLRIDLSMEQGHGLAQRDIWKIINKRVSGFDLAPPPSAMLAGPAGVTVWEKVHIKLHAVIWTMLGYLPHCADNGREPTSVAFMSKEESMHRFLVGLVRQITAPNPAIPGVLQNMFPMANNQMQQFNALPMMPIQAMTQQATRHARRVYVGGLPPTANEQSVAIFFSQVMASIGGNTAGPGDAVVNVYINHDKKFAFVEMRSVEEASNAMALDGIIFEGAPVKVRRPTDYNPSLAATLGPSQPNPNLNLGAVGLTPGSAGGLEGPDRIFVGGLPYYFTETQIRELLETFGPLRGFDLVKDRETGNSKGYAFCVYQDLAVTDIACAALNGIKMGDKTLTVRRANQGTTQPKPEQESILMHAQQQIALQKLIFQPALVATKVVCLTNAVAPDELKEDEDYEEIIDDMRQECSKFGTLVNVVIPRPQPDGDLSGGVGKVFLEYVDIEGATKARTGLNGRKFGGNEVIAVFYPENKFAQGDYEG
ncbi:splicing factor U2af large subunit B-like protein [Trifolium pratense]|uniref:Splicing factor U2af large subunit n=3 Tax=Trifolium TaxID=3898 RepID=A0A2K3PIC7_TRIPR|nr:splicing factor U2af large subunit B-like protein [Trifolium pratense]